MSPRKRSIEQLVPRSISEQKPNGDVPVAVTRSSKSTESIAYLPDSVVDGYRLTAILSSGQNDTTLYESPTVASDWLAALCERNILPSTRARI